MANLNLEINKQMAVVSGLCMAIAFGYLDHQYGPFGNPFMTALIAGLVGWGFGYADAKSGTFMILIAAVVFGLGLLGNP